MSVVPGLLVATAMFSGEVPASERVRKLSAFFLPPPGTELALSDREVRDFAGRVDPQLMRGFLTVNPPRGVCFTVRRDADTPDISICKSTQVSFLVTDLDRLGRLHWEVMTGEGDFGTELIWKTPYRAAVLTPIGADLGAIQYKFIKECRAFNSAAGRRIEVALLSGETWAIDFPDKDELPGSAIDAPEPVAGVDGEPIKKQEPPNRFEDRKVWAISWHGSHKMNSSAFQPTGSVAPGIIKGECRYTYQGTVEDPNTGRIECHQTDGYSMVYMPLTCLGRIKPKIMK